MSDEFDAYFKWLGIPPEEQPPHHYRLLGVPLYVADLDVIANAADQRMAHLKGFQAGKYSQLSQDILNEISKARLCLLDPRKKAAYDAELRQRLQPQPARPARLAPSRASATPPVAERIAQNPAHNTDAAPAFILSDERDDARYPTGGTGRQSREPRRFKTRRILPFAITFAILGVIVVAASILSMTSKERPAADVAQVSPPGATSSVQPVPIVPPRTDPPRQEAPSINGDGPKQVPAGGTKPAVNAPPRPEGANAIGLPVVAYWRFEEPAVIAGAKTGQGAQAAVEDVSGNNNHLHLSPGSDPPRFTTTVAGAKIPSTGEPNNQCLDDRAPAKENGATWGLATKATQSPLDLALRRLDTWTIEASFLIDEWGLTQTILGKDGPPNAEEHSPLQLRVRGDNNHVEIEAIDSTGAVRRVESAAEVLPGRWYHIAAASNGKQLGLWIDAGNGGGLRLQGIAPFSGALAQGPGEWSVGRGFSGGRPADDGLMLIDEVRITAAPLGPRMMLMHAVAVDVAVENAAPPTRPTVVDLAPTPIKFHPLKILAVEGPTGVEFQTQADGSIFVTGPNPDKAVYTVRAHTELPAISGLRLEALADNRLAGGGPGRHENQDKTRQGNFVVTSLSVAAAALESERRPAVIGWKKAGADFSQSGFSITSLADKAAGRGWGIAPQVGNGHFALLTAERGFGYSGGTWLTITIEQDYGEKCTLGRFRLTAFTGELPGEDPGAAVLVAARADDPVSKLPPNVTLPELPAAGTGPTDAIRLCEIVHTAKNPVSLKLLGGLVAMELEGASFSLEPNANANETSPRWKILLQTAEPAASTPLAVAELAIVGNELKFRWTEEGVRRPLANHLRNCLLEVSIGNERRGLALRDPILVERLNLGFNRATDPRFEVPWPPKSATLKFALPAKQAGLPDYKVSRQAAVVGKEKTEIVFSENGQPDLICVIGCAWRKSLQFHIETFYVGADGKRTSFSRAKVEKLGKQLSSQVARWKTDIADARELLRRDAIQDVPRLSRSRTYAIIRELERQGSEAEATIRVVTRTLERADAIEKAGGLPVQVYLELGECRGVLLQSKAQ